MTLALQGWIEYGCSHLPYRDKNKGKAFLYFHKNPSIMLASALDGNTQHEGQLCMTISHLCIRTRAMLAQATPAAPQKRRPICACGLTQYLLSRCRLSSTPHSPPHILPSSTGNPAVPGVPCPSIHYALFITIIIILFT